MMSTEPSQPIGDHAHCHVHVFNGGTIDCGARYWCVEGEELLPRRGKCENVEGGGKVCGTPYQELVCFQGYGCELGGVRQGVRKGVGTHEIFIDRGWDADEPLLIWTFVHCHGSHCNWCAVLIPGNAFVLYRSKKLAFETFLYK